MRSIIVDTILAKLALKPDRPVIQFEGQNITGSEFKAMILNSITALQNLADGQKVAISLDTCPEALALFLAGLSVAEDTGFFDPNWPQSIALKIAEYTAAKHVIDRTSPVLSQIRDMPKSGQCPSWSEQDPSASTSTITCFTSGSTGLPKGCRRSQTSWINSFKADAEITCLKSDDWVIVPGNFAHSLFLYAAIRGLFAGSSVALFSQFNPRAIAKCIQAFNRSAIFGVPTQIEMIEQAFSRECLNVGRILSAGSKLPTRLVSRLKSKFPQASIVEFYGTTELSYVAARIADAGDPSTLIGKPLEGVTVSVVGVDGKTLPANQIGTVFVKSRLAFNGYVSETGFKPAPEGFTVGDNGFLSDTGELHLQGRMDRTFQSGGRKTIPENIEMALSNLSGIQSAVVLPVPDPVRENRIAAVVQLHRQMSRRELVQKLNQSLPKNDIPHRFYLCPQLPTTVGGKINFRALADMVGRNQLEKLD